jgi:hypothetical protein
MRSVAFRCVLGLSFLASTFSGRPGFSATDECTFPIPAWSLEEGSSYSLTNAKTLLFASHVAEFEDRTEIERQLITWQLQDIAWIGPKTNGAYGYIAETKDYRVLIFRGTRSLEEGLKNAHFLQADLSSIGLPGRGHLGMREHFKKLYASARMILDQRPPKKLILAGHSLGGAMAMLHGMKLAQEGWDVEAVYTSGQPRVGDEEFVAASEALLGHRYFRLEHERDLTSRVPPSREAAEEFSALLPERTPGLRNQLKNLVRHLNYKAPSGLILSIGQKNELKQESGFQEEKDFWATAQIELDAAPHIFKIIQAFQERQNQHPPSAYICSLLKSEGSLVL